LFFTGEEFERGQAPSHLKLPLSKQNISGIIQYYSLERGIKGVRKE
jgi:hypothetical protein